jgi:hypothetical protein
MPIRFTPNTSTGGVDEKNFTAVSPQPVAALGAKRISKVLTYSLSMNFNEKIPFLL